MGKSNLRFGTLVCVNVVGWCVLGFYGALSAGPQQRPDPARQPFKNSVEQRNQMIGELREIKLLLKEQNELLREQAKRNKSSGESKR